MKKYNFLVLTDHGKHSDQNSLYALMAKLSLHEQCQEVFVASRSNAKNNSFFSEMKVPSVECAVATETFTYQGDGQQFMEETTLVDIRQVDVIIMRMPRPVTDAFLTFLTEIAPGKTFINHPNGIIKTSTKEFLLNFPEACPPMKLCKSAEEVLDYAAQFPVVLKPLKEYGGKGIVKITDQQVSDGNKTIALKDYLAEIKQELETEGYLAMKFLKNVSQGDKRILVVNGEILATSLRLPAPESWLCNVAQGGTSVPSTISPEEEVIIAAITPLLLKNGIVVYGADTLVGDDGKRILSEINTLSIGGFPQSEAQTGRPVVQMAINNIIQYINQQQANDNS